MKHAHWTIMDVATGSHSPAQTPTVSDMPGHYLWTAFRVPKNCKWHLCWGLTTPWLAFAYSYKHSWQTKKFLLHLCVPCYNTVVCLATAVTSGIVPGFQSSVGMILWCSGLPLPLLQREGKMHPKVSWNWTRIILAWFYCGPMRHSLESCPEVAVSCSCNSGLHPLSSLIRKEERDGLEQQFLP